MRTLDSRSRRLIDPQERPIALSKGEYALLLAFLDAPERPLSREYLLQATRLHEDIFDRSIDVQVLRLRRKLEADPKVPRVIKTERGVGYVFAIPVEQSRLADWHSVPQNRSWSGQAASRLRRRFTLASGPCFETPS